MSKYTQELYFEGYFKKNDIAFSFSGTCLFSKPLVITLTDCERKLIEEKFKNIVFPASDNFTASPDYLKERCQEMIEKYFNFNYEKRYTSSMTGSAADEELMLLFSDVSETVKTQTDEEEPSV